MSSTGIVTPSEAPAKSPRKRAKSTKKKTGPTLSDLILKAVSASTERGSMSLPALKKALKVGGYDVTKNKTRILLTVRRLVGNKSLIQTKGTGASGSFKLNRKAPAPQKKRVVKKKKPKTKKVKRASTKKETADGTPVAKKPLKKRRKAKSPKKAKKPTAAKPKKAKSPKKPKQRVTKSTRTRSSVKK